LTGRYLLIARPPDPPGIWLFYNGSCDRQCWRGRRGRVRPGDPGIGRGTHLRPGGPAADPQAHLQDRLDDPGRRDGGRRGDAVGCVPTRGARGMRHRGQRRPTGLHGFPPSAAGPAGGRQVPLRLRAVQRRDPGGGGRAGRGGGRIPPYRALFRARAAQGADPAAGASRHPRQGDGLPGRRPPGTRSRFLSGRPGRTGGRGSGQSGTTS
jgi:hypothetical protein